MSESVFLLLALGLIVGYLLVTASERSAGKPSRSRTQELDQIARDAARQIRASEHTGKRQIVEAERALRERRR